MTRRLVKSLDSRNDLVAHFVHLGQDSAVVAQQFLTKAEATFNLLLMNPHKGRPWRSPRVHLKGLRVLGIAGFRNYLVFYRPTDDAIEIFRVMHGARDLGSALLS